MFKNDMGDCNIINCSNKFFIYIEKSRKKCYNIYVGMSSQIRLRLVRRNADGIVPMALIHLLSAHISLYARHA